MKKIGILGWSIGDNSFGITKPYYYFFANFGEIEIITPGASIKKDLDLLVLPGGLDVDPKRYGEFPGIWTGQPNPIFEWFDKVMLPEYINQGTPIFGICRGLQTLNVHFGGSLFQHLRKHPTSTESRTELAHGVHSYEKWQAINQKRKDNPNKIISTKDEKCLFKVNSLHHQGIKALGEGLKPLLVSSLLAPIIEAIEHEQLPIAAVQWHPEEIWDEFSINLIKKLLKINNNEQN